MTDLDMKKAAKTKPFPKRRNLPACYLAPEAFADLKHALSDALAFERGKRRGLAVTRIHVPAPTKASHPDCEPPTLGPLVVEPVRWKGIRRHMLSANETIQLRRRS